MLPGSGEPGNTQHTKRGDSVRWWRQPANQIESASPVAEKLTRSCSRALAFIERLDAIYKDVPVPISFLNPPPLTPGHVVDNFADPFGVNVQLIKIVDEDVCWASLPKEPTMPHPGSMGG